MVINQEVLKFLNRLLCNFDAFHLDETITPRLLSVRPANNFNGFERDLRLLKQCFQLFFTRVEVKVFDKDLPNLTVFDFFCRFLLL